MAGWLLITSGRAYRGGDRIDIASIKGDVIGFSIELAVRYLTPVRKR